MQTNWKRTVLALQLAALAAFTCGAGATDSILVGRAVLPADSFAGGPTSGQYISGNTNGRGVPFEDKQPVQGFSAVLKNGDGSFLVMSDNGYGSLENSADYNLRVYRIRPEFKTRSGGSGTIKVLDYFELRDPDHKVPFAITNHFTKSRVLTGADFDIESMQRAADGTLWFGDEFGPFLLHTDARGKVLEAPIPLPDFANPGQEIRSPQSPLNEEASAVRIMNAVRAHARKHGNARTPVFSPYHVMLKYDDSALGVKSDPNAHYARGKNSPADLKPAASDVFDIRSIKSAGYSVVTWTVNDKLRMLELMKAGVSGIISDRPDLLLEAVKEFDANGDGKPGDYLTTDGLIDSGKFDAQGHRGGRNLRPENTLPAMEVALDHLMTTLEFDTGITKDGIAILKHDPYVEAQKCRRADGKPYTFDQEVLIKDLTRTEIQKTFICDNLFRGPSQVKDPALSPVSVALAKKKGYIDPYVMPTTQDVFDLVAAYIDYHRNGAGKNHADAAKRVKNAEQVRFNIETKINPRSDKDGHGNAYKERTAGPAQMADTLAGVIAANGLEARADIQSFDFRTLLRVQKRFPKIRTVYLFGDFPIYNGPDSDDGTNLQDEDGENTPWLAGLYWPYRVTVAEQPFRAERSGGFEGMAVSPNGRKLYPLLERPLAGDDPRALLIHEFDVRHRHYTGRQFRYPLDARGTNIGDFILTDRWHGLVIERDGTQGDLNGFKQIFRITLQGDGEAVDKQPLVDLMKIADPYGISQPAQPGDVGVGPQFAFPFVTIEDVVLLGRNTIGVINDNNYPFSVGRHVGSKQPDDNEFIVIELPEPLTGGGGGN